MRLSFGWDGKEKVVLLFGGDKRILTFYVKEEKDFSEEKDNVTMATR